MDQLLTAVEEYFMLPVNVSLESRPESRPESSLDDPVVSRIEAEPSEYSLRMRIALNDIAEAQIALDDANIDIQERRPIIQSALRKARSASKKKTNPRMVFASVFRVSAPEFARLFDTLLARKEMSQISIIVLPRNGNSAKNNESAQV